MKTVGISIEEWSELAKEGVFVPVEITLSGASMQPLIRMNRDKVTILPVEKTEEEHSDPENADSENSGSQVPDLKEAAPEGSPLKVGDIVLFKLPNGIAVVHRIFRIEGEMVTTLGDNLPDPDPPMNRSQILGKVIRIQRGRKILITDSKEMQRYGKICMNLLPIRKRVLKLKYWLRKKQEK